MRTFIASRRRHHRCWSSSAVAALGVARLERHMADAQQQLATLQYDAAKDSLDEAGAVCRSRALGPVARPRRASGDPRPRRRRCSTGRSEYDELLPAQAEPVAAVGDDNVELQLVVANAAYRAGQGRSKDKAATMKALEEAASGYLTVLKNNTWHTEAAYNYEYIVRLRDELAKGKQPPQPPKDQTEESDNGESARRRRRRPKGFQIYIPLEQGEKNPSGGEAGKAAPKERKGEYKAAS